MQDTHKPRKTQIRDLATPQGLHTPQIQCLQGYMVIALTEVAGKMPVECFTHMDHATVDTGQVLLSFLAIVRVLRFAREAAVGLGNLLQSTLERLGSLNLGAIIPCEVGSQPKVKTCALTRHSSVNRLCIKKAREVDIQLSEGITFDSNRFDSAFYIARLGKLVDSAMDLYAIGTKKLPAILRHGERFSLGNLPKCGGSHSLRGLSGFAIAQALKETLIAFVNPVNNVLNDLSAQLFPPGIFRQTL